jgi:hypothetical protein
LNLEPAPLYPFNQRAARFNLQPLTFNQRAARFNQLKCNHCVQNILNTMIAFQRLVCFTTFCFSQKVRLVLRFGFLNKGNARFIRRNP